MLKYFLKRTVVALGVIFIIAVYLCAGAVSLRSSSERTQTVYFVVDVTDSIAASAELISIRGGAGYVTASGEVAFSVYFSKSEAERARENILAEYPNAAIRAYRQYDGGERDENFLLSALKSVEGWGQVLKEGVSQERIREGLQGVSSLLRYRGENSKNSCCEHLAAVLDECLDGIITLGKVRYFLCFAVESLWNTRKSEII